MIQRMLFIISGQCFVLRVDTPSRWVSSMAWLSIPDSVPVVPIKDRFGLFAVEDIIDSEKARDIIDQFMLTGKTKLF